MQNATQSTSDSVKVSSLSTDSNHQSLTDSVPSNQKEHASLKDELESIQTTSESTSVAPQTSNSSASIDTSSEPPYKAIIHCHDKLVMALSNDLLSISGILLANEFISSQVSSKMLLPTLISQEKATILVNAVVNKIKVAPK